MGDRRQDTTDNMDVEGSAELGSESRHSDAESMASTVLEHVTKPDGGGGESGGGESGNTSYASQLSGSTTRSQSQNLPVDQATQGTDASGAGGGNTSNATQLSGSTPGSQSHDTPVDQATPGTGDDPPTLTRADIGRRVCDAFGYESVRDTQLDAIEAVLKGRDVVAIMPTGSGKSLIYQGAGYLSRGLTLCITPLNSIAKNQNESLEPTKVSSAIFRAGITEAEVDAMLEAARRGQLDVVYASPEKFLSPQMEGFVDRLHKDGLLRVVAVDEAHCLSIWGDVFRKDYGKLGIIRKRFGHGVPIVALTATASGETEREIVEKLGLLPNRLTVVDTSPRYNTTVEVEIKNGPKAALKTAADAVLALPAGGRALVFCKTRESTENIAADLSRLFTESRRDDLAGKVGRYHGKLTDHDKSVTVKKFMRGEIRVVTCTLAMGMGVDIPGIELVVHLNAPPSAERYIQEIGRAGRGDTPCRALLLRSTDDLGRLRGQIAEEGGPGQDRKLRALTAFSRWAYGETECLLLGLVRCLDRPLDSSWAACGDCTNCVLKQGPIQAVDVTAEAKGLLDLAVFVRKKYKNRATKNRLVKWACGEKHRDDDQKGLSFVRKSPSFGCCRRLGEGLVPKLIDSMLVEGLFEIYLHGEHNNAFIRPGEAATGGNDAIRHEVSWRGGVPGVAPREGASPPTKRQRVASPSASVGTGAQGTRPRLGPDAAASLGATLRRWREDEGKEHGVPVCYVLRDVEVEEVVRELPTTVGELARLGQFKTVRKAMDDYGQSLVDCVVGFLNANTRSPSTPDTSRRFSPMNTENT